MGEILKYKPDEKPGYRIEMFKCSWCFGARYYSGKYGMTACEQCTKGYQYRYVKLRKTKGGYTMKTKEEILTKYSDGNYKQFKGYKNILLAMDEYAQQDKVMCRYIIIEDLIKPECCGVYLQNTDMRKLNYIYCPFCGKKIERVKP